MKFKAMAALAMTMALAHPAAAQDAPQPYPEMRERLPRDPLSGLRIEATVGYDRLEASYIEDDTKYFDGYDGVGFGGEIGYDVAVNRSLLLGAYAGIGQSTQKQCDEIFGDDELCQEPGMAFAAGARLGVRAGSKSQFYLRGGYSRAKLKLEYDAPGTFSDFSDDENYSGYHVGVGGEYGLGGRAFVKGELTVTEYSTNEKLYDGVSFQRRQAIVGLGVRL